ncbi:hypothetical protein ACQ4PT_019957 [Festuca glaucescens]
MRKPSVKMAMPSSSHIYTPLLLLLLLACSCKASSGNAVDPTCPPAKTSAVWAAAETSSCSAPQCQPSAPHIPVPVFPYDVDPLQFALNLEYTEAEFFLHAAYGVGLDQIAPNLTLGGPPPVGAMKANLDEVTWRVVAEFGLQEVGHVRAIQRTVGGFPRPKIDLSAKNFARVMDAAFGYKLNPPFDPYVNSLNFLLACYDEGLTVPPELGTEGKICTNVLSADRDSLSYPRTPAQLLGIMYLSGVAHVPGRFFPEGANGKIAREFLGKPFAAGEN